MYRVLLCSATVAMIGLVGLATAGQDTPQESNTPAKAAQQARRRPSDVVFLLIETSGIDEESTAELQRMYDVLRKLDKNNNGTINPGELKAARAQLVEDRLDHLFSKLDTDEDGYISRDEAKGRILEHFDNIDTDEDGYISRDEMREAITSSQSRRVSR
jgi:Ca2+-binding EF-hand superfamily protein